MRYICMECIHDINTAVAGFRTRVDKLLTVNKHVMLLESYWDFLYAQEILAIDKSPFYILINMFYEMMH